MQAGCGVVVTLERLATPLLVLLPLPPIITSVGC
jgi:hypothetical protein